MAHVRNNFLHIFNLEAKLRRSAIKYYFCAFHRLCQCNLNFEARVNMIYGSGFSNMPAYFSNLLPILLLKISELY